MPFQLEEMELSFANLNELDYLNRVRASPPASTCINNIIYFFLCSLIQSGPSALERFTL